MCGEYRFNIMYAPGDIVVHMLFIMYALYAIYKVARGLLRKGLNKAIKN